jgi:ankyrin repeat protein
LLDAGEDPNRYNLEGNHAHSTLLHQAVLTGNEAVVRLLVEHGATAGSPGHSLAGHTARLGAL